MSNLRGASVASSAGVEFELWEGEEEVVEEWESLLPRPAPAA